MLSDTDRSVITRLRNLPARRLRAVMMAMALVVAGAQLALVVHHSTELLPEPPGHVCTICMVGSGLVGLHAAPPVLVTPPTVSLGIVPVQSYSFHSLRLNTYHARDPPRHYI